MKPVVFLIITTFISGTVFAQHATLTQTVKGIVIDEQSGNVLSNATVVIEGYNLPGDITDSLGNFKLKAIPIGRQNLKVTLIGYEESVIRSIEVTSSKEVVVEVRMKELFKKLEEVIVRSGKQKNKSLNEAAVVSARQLSVDEAMRYSGTRNDPSRMA